MKFVVTGDWHIDESKIGKVNPESDLDVRIEDTLAAVDRIIDFAISKKCDLFIMNGDLFKGRTSSHHIETLVAQRFQRIASHMQLKIVLGNHDYTARSLAFQNHTYSIIEQFNIQNVEIILDLQHQSHSDVDLVFYPYHDLRSRENFESNESFLSKLADDISKFSYTKPHRIFVGHGTPEGTIINEQYLFDLGSIEEPILPKSIFKDFELALFSHIHRTHWVGDKIFHIGSPERVNFSEADQDKGFAFYDSDVGKMEFISTNPRPMYDLSLDLKEIDDFTDPTELIISHLSKCKQLTQAMIKLKIVCSEKTRLQIDDNQLNAVLQSAFYHTLRYDIVRTEERYVRIAELTEHITAIDALERVLLSRESLSEEDKKQIVLRGKAIVAMNKDL